MLPCRTGDGRFGRHSRSRWPGRHAGRCPCCGARDRSCPTRRAGRQREADLDFWLHMILANQPAILDGLAEAVQLGVTSFKLFMTYKKRPNRMCSDDFICRAMARIASLGGVTQLHCESGDVLNYLEEKAL